MNNINKQGRCCKHPDKPLYMTTWRPKPGIDSMLREFRCLVPRCDTVVYRRVKVKA